MNVSFLLAKRLYAGGAMRGKVSTPAISIATLGVAIGLATMIISICVVLGFQKKIKEKVIGFGADIEVVNVKSISSTESAPVIADEFMEHNIKSVPGVKSIQRFAITSGILKTERDFKGIQLKGVGADYDLSFLSQNVVEGKVPSFSELRNSNLIVLSYNVAKELGLKLNDQVYAYFFDKSIKTRRFRVCAIYRTNLEQFDNSIVYADLGTVQQLNGWRDDQCSGYEIKIFENASSSQAVFQMANFLKMPDKDGEVCTALSIEELYPQIFDWLGLLDMNVWIILILMVCVGGFTMISGLLILILENTNTIGLLKALGATDLKIRRIFLYFSIFIIGRGLLWGNILGIGLCLIQNYFPFVKLDAETYYVENVPIYFNPILIVALNVVTLLVTVFSLIGPSFLVSHIQPAKSIRYE